MSEPRNNEYADKQTTLNQDHPPRIVWWIWLYYRPDLRLAVWKQARYFSFTKAPQNTEFLSLWRGGAFLNLHTRVGDRPITFTTTPDPLSHAFMCFWGGGIQYNILHKRVLSDVVFQSRSWFLKNEFCFTLLSAQSWLYRDRRKPEAGTMPYSYFEWL